MISKILAFEIAASFEVGSKGRAECRLVDKRGEFQLGSEAWRIGFKAFEWLSVEDRNIIYDSKRLFDYLSGWIELIDERMLEIQSIIDSGPTNIVDELTGDKITNLYLSDADWQSKLKLFVSFLQATPQYVSLDLVNYFGGLFVLAVFYQLDDAVIATQLGDHELLADSMMGAAWFLHQLDSADRTSTMAASELKRLDSRRASQRAQRRHEVDPKRKAKDFAKECWQAWRAEPERYPSATAFARSMVEKFPDELTSEIVVTRWVRQWDKEPK